MLSDIRGSNLVFTSDFPSIHHPHQGDAGGCLSLTSEVQWVKMDAVAPSR